MSSVINEAAPGRAGVHPEGRPVARIVVSEQRRSATRAANLLFSDGVRVYFVDDQIRAKVAQADAKATWCTDIPFSSDPRATTGIDNAGSA